VLFAVEKATEVSMTEDADSQRNILDPNSPAGAPGAVPPTGGVPPEDAPPASGSAAETRSASDDLADGIDLMLRAARKALRAVDPRIEAGAALALQRLRELDEQAEEAARRKLGMDRGELEKMLSELGRDTMAAVERVTKRIDDAFTRPR
jgi:hypothetical protein